MQIVCLEWIYLTKVQHSSVYYITLSPLLLHTHIKTTMLLIKLIPVSISSSVYEIIWYDENKKMKTLFNKNKEALSPETRPLVGIKTLLYTDHNIYLPNCNAWGRSCRVLHCLDTCCTLFNKYTKWIWDRGRFFI